MSLFPPGTQALLNGDRCTLFIDSVGIVAFAPVDDYRFRLLQEYFRMNMEFPLEDTPQFWFRLNAAVSERWSHPKDIPLEEIFS